MFAPETMLRRAQDLTRLQVLHDVADQYMLEYLAWHAGEGDWAVVDRVIVFPFLVDRGDMCDPPVCRDHTRLKRGLVDGSQDGSDFSSKFF